MEPLLEMKQVSKTFKQRNLTKQALKNVSFSLYPGDSLGIVGESGSGKSTIARIITGQTETFDGGEIRFMGREMPSGRWNRSWVYENMQMVFQQPLQSFNPRIRLGNSVTEGMRLRGMSKRDAEEKMGELFQICGLSMDTARRYPHQVSGGECQRAAIARALSLNPKLVVFDEATSALDVAVQWQVLELMKNLKARFGLTYIFISHDMGLIQETCGRVMVLQKGEIVEMGTREQVIGSPEKDYTKTLIQAVI